MCISTNTSSQCILNDHCGWCNRTQFPTCEEGNSTGPFDKNDCLYAKWIGRNVVIPAIPHQEPIKNPSELDRLPTQGIFYILLIILDSYNLFFISYFIC